MFEFVLYFVPAMIVMGVCHHIWKSQYTIGEFLTQFFVTAAVIGIIIFIDGFSNRYDYKFVNGVVSSKEPVKKTCRSTWETYEDSWCRHHHTRYEKEYYWTTDEKGKSVRRSKIVTYYKPEYRWEQRFYVNTTVGNYEISGEDRQGSIFPARYNNVVIGDPATATVGYTNYVKAAASSLFRYEDDTFKETEVPRGAIYDYYNINRFHLDLDVESNLDVRKINRRLSELNSSIDKSANVVVYMTDKPESFASALQVKWGGFKINDLIIVLGVDMENDLYTYVKVFSWSESSMVEVVVKDKFFFSKPSEFEKVLDESFETVKTNFVEAKPEKFAYLASQAEMSWVAIILLIIVTVIVTPVVAFIFKEGDFL